MRSIKKKTLVINQKLHQKVPKRLVEMHNRRVKELQKKWLNSKISNVLKSLIDLKNINLPP